MRTLKYYEIMHENHPQFDRNNGRGCCRHDAIILWSTNDDMSDRIEILRKTSEYIRGVPVI